MPALSNATLPQDIPSKCLDARIILLGPILQEIDLELVEFLRKRSSAEIFLDPQGIIREIGENGRIHETCNRARAEAFVKLVDIVKPNEHESETLTGIKDPYDSAEHLVKWGAKIGIVTLAERGSILYNEKSFIRIPAYGTTAKDPTGAGDTYAGAFIRRHLEGADLFDVAVFASAAASIKVEYTGPDFPLEYSKVNERVQEMRKCAK